MRGVQVVFEVDAELAIGDEVELRMELSGMQHTVYAIADITAILPRCLPPDRSP